MRESKIKGTVYVYDPASGKMVEKKRPEVIELPYKPEELESHAEAQLYNVNYDEARKLRETLNPQPDDQLGRRARS
jgi:hypothetical protein